MSFASLLLPTLSLGTYAVLHAMFARSVRSLRTPPAPGATVGPVRAAREGRGVTLLKACAGADEALEQCLTSYFALAHHPMQILLGVSEEGDPAVPIIRRVIDRHPWVDAALVIVPHVRHASPKINTLAALATRAKHDVLWLSDSNTEVAPDALGPMLDAIARPGVGAVVSVVASDGEQTLGAALDNLAVNAWVTFGAVTMLDSRGVYAGAGKSILLTRETLDRAGGWGPMGECFADDTVLLGAITALGLRVIAAPTIIRCPNGQSTFGTFWRRHGRWSQIRLAIAPYSLPIEVLCSPFAVALGALAFAPSSATLAMLAVCAVAQLAGDCWVTRRLRGRWIPARLAVAALLRPLVMALLHVRSLFTRKTNWRGRVAWMGPGSRIVAREVGWVTDGTAQSEDEEGYAFEDTLGPPVAAHAARASAPSPGSD